MKPNFKISKQTTSTIGSYTISLSPPQLVPKSTRCPRGTVLIKRIREEDLALEKFSSSFKTTISTTKLTESITPNIDSVPGHYRDTGKITGCYNALCPGFVQVSQSVTLGQVIDPISTYWGHQVFTNTTIQQDQVTKNWWLIFETEPLGYFPKELFSTLANGATRAGWGGEVYTPTTATSPAMGSGNFPEDGYSKACLISKMQVIGPQYFPNGTDLRQTITKADCYRALYGGNVGGDFDNHMFVGGPANCNA
uniref:Neprosin PEP catalytic domain-containing protein n=1 Tax=Chenopodium quinoa TaxID=63459 RepID=A0A803LQG5_CHEQI